MTDLRILAYSTEISMCTAIAPEGDIMPENHTLNSMRTIVLTAVMAALIAAGAFLSFPLPFTPVPITLQTLFVLVAGLFLTPVWAGLSVFLYLFAGIIGLPVFAGGNRGFSVIMGPSGGFLIGMFVAAIVLSLIVHVGKGKNKSRSIIRDVVGVIVATFVIYGVGYPWIVVVLNWEWKVGLARAVLPFLPGDTAKMIVAVLVAIPGRRILFKNA